MAFAIVEFLDYPEDPTEPRDLATIPQSWFCSDEEGVCRYPPFQKRININKINKQMQDKIEPQKAWPEHRISVRKS